MRRRPNAIPGHVPSTPQGSGPSRRERALTLAWFYMLGGLAGVGAILLGLWPDADVTTLGALAVIALAVGTALWALADRVDRPLLSLLLLLGTLIIATAQFAAGSPTAAAAYGTIYIFVVACAVLVLEPVHAAAHLCVVAVAHIFALSRMGAYAPADRRGMAAHVFITATVGFGVAAVVAYHLHMRRRAERRARENSLTDGLTGLANRAALVQRLDEVITTGADPSALLLVDVSNFRDINDTFGADLGDQLLRMVGLRLCSVVRAEDLVARIGGDEFAVLLANERGTDAAELAQLTARRLLDTVHQPFHVEDIALSIEARAGVALTTEGGSSQDLLRQADLALERARDDARSIATVDRVPPRRSPDRMALLTEVRRSLEAADDPDSGALIPYFQPVVSVHDRQIVGAEALVRWRHPTRGLLSPATFLPLVERTSLMRALTAHMLGNALEACARWHRAGMSLSVSLNISARDLSDPDLVPAISASIARTQLPPSALTVEITETALMEDIAQASEVTEELRALGTGVSVDDFGTGWSSLIHLQRLPVTELKIDRSFVSSAREDDDAAKIVAATVGLGRSLGLAVVAEGVEDAATLGWLADLGCDLAQGWHFGRPMPEDEFAAHAARAPAVRPPRRLGTSQAATGTRSLA